MIIHFWLFGQCRRPDAPGERFFAECPEQRDIEAIALAEGEEQKKSATR